MKRIASLLLLGASALLAQDHAQPVATGNHPIGKPGNYVLVKDIVGGLTISGDDVTLDLNGYSVNGPGGKSGTGIHIMNGHGVKISGGSVNNFAFGVIVENSTNVEVRGLRVRAQDLPVIAPPPEIGIMIVQSANVVVEDNLLYGVGLGIFVRGSMSHGNRIANNTLTAGMNGVLGICYNPAPGDPMGPRGDLVYNNLVSGFANGIALTASKGNVIRENTVIYTSSAITLGDPSNVDQDNTKVMLP